MKLTKQEVSILRSLVESPGWDALTRLAGIVCANIRGASSVRDTDEKTLRATYEKEAKAQGINLFLQEVFTQISND